MDHDEPSAPWGTYLTGLLASGERAFRYRNGVHRLLGVPDVSDAGIAFLPPMPPGAFRYPTGRLLHDPPRAAVPPTEARQQGPRRSEPRHPEPRRPEPRPRERLTESVSLEIPGVTASDSRTCQVRGGGEDEREQGSEEAAGVARRRASEAGRREPRATARAEESSEAAASARLALVRTDVPRPQELAPSGETFRKKELGAGDAAPGTVEGIDEAATAPLDAPRASGQGQAVAHGTASEGGTAPTTIDVSSPVAGNETFQRPVTAHSSSLGTGLGSEGFQSLVGARRREPVGSGWPQRREGLKSLATQSRPKGRRRTRPAPQAGETEPRDDEATRPGIQPKRNVDVAGIAPGSEDAVAARLAVARRRPPNRGTPPTLRPGPDVVTPRVPVRSGNGDAERPRRAVTDLEARRQAAVGEPETEPMQVIDVSYRETPSNPRPGPNVLAPRVPVQSGTGGVERLRRAVADLEARRQAPVGEPVAEPPPPMSFEPVFPEHAGTGEHGAEDDADVEPETAMPPAPRSLRNSSTMRSRHFRILR